LWSASVAGRPVRPGRAPDGSLLLPLEKTKSGEEAPAFVVEVAYMDRMPSWSEKGRAKLSLLTLDMPISKSGLLMYYPPLFRVSAVPGSFRVATYEGPRSAALSSGGGTQTQIISGVAGKSPVDAKSDLVLQLQQSGRASRPSRNLPIRVAFPHLGPSIFLVSELTSENQTPAMEFDFQRDKKRGDR